MGEKLSAGNLEGEEKIRTLNKIAEVAYQQVRSTNKSNIFKNFL